MNTHHVFFNRRTASYANWLGRFRFGLWLIRKHAEWTGRIYTVTITRDGTTKAGHV